MHSTSKNTLPLDTIQALARHQELLTIEPGQVIFRSGDRGDCLYGVLEGTVELEWNAGAMTERIGPGETFGIGAFLDPEHRRFGTARALTEGKLVVMNQQQFLFAVQETPMFALEMLQSLGARLRDLKRRVQDQLGTAGL
jgi:CRP-like cAMP-binding protein